MRDFFEAHFKTFGVEDTMDQVIDGMYTYHTSHSTPETKLLSKYIVALCNVRNSWRKTQDELRRNKDV